MYPISSRRIRQMKLSGYIKNYNINETFNLIATIKLKKWITS